MTRKDINILVACEESQAVMKEFRKLGYNAYSCDLQECSGGLEQYHIKDNVLKVLKMKKWHVLIAFPPCTYLSNAGARWLYPTKGNLCFNRYSKGLKAKDFFMTLLNYDIPLISIENPKSSKIYDMPMYSQVIQPYQFGHPYSKHTRLWLKGLPNLIPTNILSEYQPYLPSNTTGFKKGQKSSKGVVSGAKNFSKTFNGVAVAMANQWCSVVDNYYKVGVKCEE